MTRARRLSKGLRPRGRPQLTLDPELLAPLVEWRGAGVPLQVCADRLGVDYGALRTNAKLRELGLACRLNRGPMSGERAARERPPELCVHCGEPLDGERAVLGGASAHVDCLFRMIAGGLNHQLGRCGCFGGTEPPDPPGMTKRQAAKAVADYFREHPTHG